MQTNCFSEHRSSYQRVSQGYLERNRGIISLCTLLWCPETCYQLIQAEQCNNPPAVFAFGSGSCEIEGRENIDPCWDGMTSETNVRVSLNPWTSAQMLFFWLPCPRETTVCTECMYTRYDFRLQGLWLNSACKPRSMFSILEQRICPSATFAPLSPDIGRGQRCAVPFLLVSSFSQISMWPMHPLLSSFVLTRFHWTELTLGPQYGAAKAWKSKRLHLNSFASVHNAIRCDYFCSPADVSLSDHLSIRVAGAVQTLMEISPMCHLGSF